MMEVPFVNLKAQYERIKPGIDAAIASVFASGQFVGGPSVTKFELEFAQLLNAAHCITTGNGTDAILIALKSLSIQKSDEIIVPAFGWISASEMVTLAGATPVFCDVLPAGIIDPQQIESKITTRTKGIIIVHLYGQAAHARQIKQICEKHNLFMIEDCAQAHLTKEFDKFAGTIGDAGTFSFYPTKNLGAYGDGGCVLTQNAEAAKSMRLFSNHGGLQQHIMEGTNSRLDSIQAAVLSEKIHYIHEWTQKRIENATLYSQLLKDVHTISLPETRAGTVHSFHQYVIRTRYRDELKEFLLRQGIHTIIHYPVSVHNLPAYQYMHLQPSDYPMATRCQHEVLSLPVYPELTTEQISFVCEQTSAFFKAQ